MSSGPSADHQVPDLIRSVAAEGVVAALIEQLVVGQGAALYGLHSAAASLRQWTKELTSAADAVPTQVAAAVTA